MSETPLERAFTAPPLEQSFADYRVGDQITITPKPTRLFEVVHVDDEGMRIAAMGGDGAGNLQWVVSLDYVRLIRRPDPEPAVAHGPANSAAGSVSTCAVDGCSEDWYHGKDGWVSGGDPSNPDDPTADLPEDTKLYALDGGDVNLLLTLLGVKLLQITRQLRGADAQTAKDIKTYDADPDELRAILDKLRT
jgi:hypothetical protein